MAAQTADPMVAQRVVKTAGWLDVGLAVLLVEMTDRCPAEPMAGRLVGKKV